MKKTLAGVAVAAMLLFVGCAGRSDTSNASQSYSPLDFSGSTLTAQVQEVSGQQLTISIGGRMGMQTVMPNSPDAQPPQDIQAPAQSAEATPSADASASADVTPSTEATPSATPEASGSTDAQQTLPAVPGQGGQGSMLAGATPNNIEAATAQMIVPDSNMIYVLNGSEETQGNMGNIKENSTIRIEFGDNNKIVKITVID